MEVVGGVRVGVGGPLFENTLRQEVVGDVLEEVDEILLVDGGCLGLVVGSVGEGGTG